MKRVKNFKQFESKVSIELTQDDIKDIFIDLIDARFQIKFLNSNSFELRRDRHEIPDEEFGWIDEDGAWGVTDFDAIGNQLNLIQDCVKEAKSRMEAAGYKIGFDLNFNFTQPSIMYIGCHMTPGLKYVNVDSNHSALSELRQREHELRMEMERRRVESEMEIARIRAESIAHMNR